MRSQCCRRRVSVGLSALVLSGVLSAAGSAGADLVTLPYSEDFQNPAPSADAAADYPEFDANLGGGTATVDANGVLHLIPSSATDQVFTVTPQNPTGEITIFAQIGAGNSNGDYNVGLVLGDNNLVFHPGYPAGGAFRVEGPGGFGNQDMGFVPANDVLHQFEFHSFPNGDVTIRVTDGQNAANVYTASFNNPGSYGGPIGFRRSGPPNDDGIYDNLQIIPEPTLLLPLALAAIGLAGRRRRA